MRLSDIFHLFQRYALLGLATVIIGCTVFLLVYFVIYKHLLKGQKQLSLKRLIAWGAFLCYIIIVLGATLMFRTEGIYGSRIDFSLFDQYRSAWFKFSAVEWRNIILNIAMFIPFGFIIPFLSIKIQKAWKVFIIGLAATLFIECTQLITGRGIFAFDDIFHNTFGAIIGFGLFRTVFIIIRERPFRISRLVISLSPLLVATLTFSGIFAVYKFQEFGNMPQAYARKQNMKDITLNLETALSENSSESVIYASSLVANKEQTRAFAESFFTALGATLNENNVQLYDETVFYRANKPAGQELSLVINFRAMTYWYTDFSFFDFEVVINAEEHLIREKLKEIGIHVPENTVFTELDNGSYYFDVAFVNDDIEAVFGSLECTLYSDDTIKSIRNNLVACTPVNTVEIISEREAYKLIEKGLFSHYLAQEQNLMRVLSVELNYSMDTKGYFQPVYLFHVELNGHNTIIIIPARK